MAVETDRVIALLRECVAFPSVSNVSNVDVSDWVRDRLEQIGCETEYLTYKDSNGVTKAAVAARCGPTTGRGAAYFCHSDVVSADAWDFAGSGPWSLCQTEDRVYGRGSCDMKGSLCCMLAALEQVSPKKLQAPVFFICTPDEEIGMQGARHVAAESSVYREIAAGGHRGIVGEPTSLRVVHAHKGGVALRITSKGRAAHSSTCEGVNANMAMIPFLNDLHALCLETTESPEWQDARYDPPGISMNIGINDFSPTLNITPPQSVCTVYFRPMPQQNADLLIERINRSAAAQGLDCRLLFRSEPVFTSPDSEFVRELLEVTDEETSNTVAYGTDGGQFREVRDLAVLGPGDIRQAHTSDEWISVAQLSKGAALYRELIRRWCECG